MQRIFTVIIIRGGKMVEEICGEDGKKIRKEKLCRGRRRVGRTINFMLELFE